MPVLKVKTNQTMTFEQKKELSTLLKNSFAKAGELPVSKNVLISVEDHVFIDFREDCETPAALITAHPGPMTPVEDYAPIVAEFYEAFKTVLPDIPQDHIYVTVANIDYWGWNGKLL